MVKIGISDAVVVIEGDEKDLKAIDNFCTYDDTSACFGRGGYDIRKIKKVKLLKNIKGKLVGFAGLAKEIALFCKNNSIKIKSFEDTRTHFDFQEKDWTHDELREFFPKEFKYVEHQIRALQAMIKTNKALIKAATSAGKSSIMLAFLKLSNLPTLILTDRSTLGAQLAEDFRSKGIDCGFNAGANHRDGYCMVSTIQSVKKIQDLPRFKCVIIDESHRSSAKQFQEFLSSFGCPLKYGFSASPSNGNLLDFAKIRQHLGSIAIDIGAKELMENEVMAKAKIKLVKSECPEAFDYPSSYELGIVKNEIRNKQIKEIADRYEDGVCILIKNIEHGEELEKMLPGSVFLRGENTLKERVEAIKQFNEGKIKILIGSNILNEGISISNMKILIMASGGKAKTQTVQKIGRVLRISENKKEGIFYDFIDYGNKYLLKHSKMRITLYKKEGFTDIEVIDKI